MIDYNAIALNNLVNKCIYNWIGSEWEGLTWLDSRPKPTKEAWEVEKARLIALAPLQERQTVVKKLLADTDYVELPSYLERNPIGGTGSSDYTMVDGVLQRTGVNKYEIMMAYRAELRKAFHDLTVPIPEFPKV